MHIFYIIALIPLVASLLLWLRSAKIIWWEALSISAIGFLIASLFHWGALSGMTDDVETWSGRVTQTIYSPEWVEEWQELHVETYACGTDSKGNTEYCTRTYYTTEHDTHDEHWSVMVDFGIESDEWRVSQNTYDKITKEFGGVITLGPLQPFHHGGTYYSGNRNSYVAENRTGFIRPVTQIKTFENRIKATPSVFSFVEVSTNIPVYSYPNNSDPWQSQRLLGTAARAIDPLLFDQFNSRLGPLKLVNVIMVGFNSTDSSLGEYQRAKWVGGKKNDIVICYGNGWTKVFGWSDSELCKRNLETIVLHNPVNNDILPLLEAEIKANYKLKDWKAFDYIAIQPRVKHVIWYVVTLIIVQGGLWVWAFLNDIDCNFRTVRRYW